MSQWGAKNLAQLVRKGGPIFDALFVVQEPRLRRVGQVEGNTSHLVFVVPPVKLAHAVVLVEPILYVIPAKTSEDGRVALAACKEPWRRRGSDGIRPAFSLHRHVW